MTKELQDNVWSILPKEYREEVKKLYSRFLFTREGYYDELFGKHNLTSDAEEEEMLCVPRKEVMNHFREANLDRIYYSNDSKDYAQATGRKIMLIRLFGKDKCLPDDVKEPKQFFESDYSIGDKVIVPISSIGEPRKEVVTLIRQYQPQCSYNDYAKQWVIQTKDGQEFQSDEMRFEPYEEPKPAEPKFKRCEKVITPSGKLCIIEDTHFENGSWLYLVDDPAQWIAESDLKPYTEPDPIGKEVNFPTKNEFRNLSQNIADCDKELDNILKDSFSKHNRLHVASMVLQGIMANPNEQMINMNINDTLNLTLRMTDALLYECEEGGKS